MPWFLQVEKQCAHFYAVTISEEEVSAGLVCRVESSSKSKFKVGSGRVFPVKLVWKYQSIMN